MGDVLSHISLLRLTYTLRTFTIIHAICICHIPTIHHLLSQCRLTCICETSIFTEPIYNIVGDSFGSILISTLKYAIWKHRRIASKVYFTTTTTPTRQNRLFGTANRVVTSWITNIVDIISVAYHDTKALKDVRCVMCL